MLFLTRSGANTNQTISTHRVLSTSSVITPTSLWTTADGLANRNVRSEKTTAVQDTLSESSGESPTESDDITIDMESGDVEDDGSVTETEPTGIWTQTLSTPVMSSSYPTQETESNSTITVFLPKKPLGDSDANTTENSSSASSNSHLVELVSLDGLNTTTATNASASQNFTQTPTSTSAVYTTTSFPCDWKDDEPFDISAYQTVTFTKVTCRTNLAIFDGKTAIDSGLSASLFLTIYKRLHLSMRMLHLVDELNEYTYSPADFV